MKKVIILSSGIFLLVLTGFVSKGFAQDVTTNAVKESTDEDVGKADDGVNYSYGKIVRISPNEVELTEYDYNYDTDEETEVKVVYAIDSATTFENVKSVADLKENDDVEVYYQEKDGKKMAVTLIKELPYEDDEAAGGDEDEDEDTVVTTPTNATKAPASLEPKP